MASSSTAFAQAAPPSKPTAEGESRRLPPHDYSLVVPGPRRADVATARLHAGMMNELRESKLLPAGFPKRGRRERSPVADRPGAFDVWCEELQGEAAMSSDCIQLGPSSYIELSSIDFPDSRAYMFEVFLFDQAPVKAPDRQSAHSMTRIVVGHPLFGEDVRFGPELHPGDIIDALQRGLLKAGARPLRLR